ncbi:MAG: hypothetical protein Q9M35_12085 [Rhodothermus sp.]|nr:hypothetical protein [Rhodothermus sp.]
MDMRPGDIGWMPRVTGVSAEREQYREKEKTARRVRRKKKGERTSDTPRAASAGDTGRHIDLRA